MKLKTLKKKELRPRKLYQRTLKDNDDHEALKASIKEKGILFPLVATEKGSGFEIIDGNRRLAACSSLGFDDNFEIPVLVIKTNVSQSVETALIANTVRSGADPLAELEAVNLLVNRYKLIVRDVAAAIGKSERYIWRLLSIYKLPVTVISALRNGNITLAHAHWLTRLSDDPKMLEDVLQRSIDEDLTSRDLGTLIADLLETVDEKDDYAYFSPKVVTTKAGSRLRFEPRKHSVRVELNIKLEEPIEVVLAELKRNLKKIAKGRLRVVG